MPAIYIGLNRNLQGQLNIFYFFCFHFIFLFFVLFFFVGIYYTVAYLHFVYNIYHHNIIVTIVEFTATTMSIN